MASVNDIARHYVDAARQQPHRAPEILRRAASHFASMAADPAHKRARDKLTTIGLDFAGAAMAQQAAAQQQQSIEPYATPTTDDFSALLQDTHQAMVELGPENAVSSNSAMDTLAERRMNDTEEARYMSVQPKSFLNRDTTLGRSTKIKFNPTEEDKLIGIRQSDTVAFWQGAKTESQAMSVDFGLVLPPPIDIFQKSAAPGPIVDSRLFARIQYGADGNTQNEATLDVRLGQRITVVGNYISVLVGMDPPRHYTPDGTDEAIGISTPIVGMGASIGTFAAPSLAPVTRSIFIDQLAAGGAGTGGFPIPQRAVAMLTPLAASMTDTLTVSFFGIDGTFIGTWQKTYSAATTFGPPYPIPADAYFIKVISAQGVPSVAPLLGGRNGIRIPFELSL